MFDIAIMMLSTESEQRMRHLLNASIFAILIQDINNQYSLLRGVGRG